jgi:hypothetical protein
MPRVPDQVPFSALNQPAPSRLEGMRLRSILTARVKHDGRRPMIGTNVRRAALAACLVVGTGGAAFAQAAGGGAAGGAATGGAGAGH